MATPHLNPVHTGFNPTRQDVQVAAQILMGLRLPRRSTTTTTSATPDRLPAELALSILSHAGYNPRITSARADEAEYRANDFWQPGPRASVAALYLTTTPQLPKNLKRVRGVTVQMRGADQGWATFGGEGTYENSHTWFEVCVLRPVGGGQGQQQQQGQQQPLEAQAQVSRTFRTPGDARGELEQLGWEIVGYGGRDTWLVHHNGTFDHTPGKKPLLEADNSTHHSTVTASRDWKNYRVDWVAGTSTEIEVEGAVGDGEGFLSALMPGDKIALWARAEVSSSALCESVFG